MYYKLEGTKLYLSDDKEFSESEGYVYTYENGEIRYSGGVLSRD